MQLSVNIKMALASLRSSRWRSILTMLGIIIGVASVVITISLGEGVRQQVDGQIKHFGSDLITVRPGKKLGSSGSESLAGLGILSGLPGGIFSQQDLSTIKSTNGVKLAVPFSLVSATSRTDDREFTNGFVIATTDGLPQVLNQQVKYGAFFGPNELDRHIAIIGKRVAQELFQENVPVGRSLQLRDQRLVVAGVFDQFDTSPLSPTADYNSAIFIPYDFGKTITGQTQIYQVLVKPVDAEQTDAVVQNLNATLSEAHGQQTDFSVLKQRENLAVTSKILSLLTTMIAGVAAISLLVGGIGIMNIMLVSVMERTNEIGVRKAVGATNRQILNQFVTEAAVLSLAGGIIGLLVSLLANYFFRVFTDVRPIISLETMGAALVAALFVGMFFGIAPALKAATRDPIEALRHE